MTTTRSSLTVVSGTAITSAWGNAVRDCTVTNVASYLDVADEFDADGQLVVDVARGGIWMASGSGTGVEILRGRGAASTSTITGTQSWTLSLTTNRCVYSNVGKWAHGEAVVTVGATGSSGAEMVFTPGWTVSPAASTPLCVGSFIFVNSGTYYSGSVFLTSTQFKFIATGTTGGLGYSPSIQAQVGSKMYFNWKYESA